MLVFTLAVAGGASRALGQYINAPPEVQARAVLHNDNTRTDVMKDPLKQEMVETTYDSRWIMISQKKYLLNENGDPMQGQIFDGAGNLVARVQFSFDEFQRLSEERCLNMQGEVFRKVLHTYDQSGHPLPVQAMDYKVHAPNMRVASLDFTRSPRNMPKSAKQPSGPVQPGQAPQIQTVSTSTGETFDLTPEQQMLIAQQQAAMAAQTKAQGQQQAKEKKKGSNLNPLNWFKKKDKDSN